MKMRTKSLLMVLPLLASLVTPTVTTFAAKDTSNDDYLHTDGSKIYDDQGNQVRLTGIAWFGFEENEGVFHGLWSNSLENMLDMIADNGFNLLRVPISVQLVKETMNGDAPLPRSVDAVNNPDLVGKSSIEILDKAIEGCKKKGIKVMLDMHRLKKGGTTNTWYNSDYTVEDFETCWEYLVDRYKDDDTVIAVDLFNEPHGKGYYAEQAAKWNDNADDPDNWKCEAERVGKKILDINPNLLLVVEGVETYPVEGHTYYDTKNKSDYYGDWWGGNLRGVKEYPVTIEGFEDKVIYSPHDYGPSVSDQPWFYEGFNRDTLEADAWKPNWGYLHDDNIAPVLIGEWGGFLNGGTSETYVRAMAQYIEEKGLNHTYWCFNPNSGDTGGLLHYDIKTIDQDRMNLIKPTLWHNEAGQCIGLDHQVNLGANGTHVGAGSTGTGTGSQDGIGSGTGTGEGTNPGTEKVLLGDINSDGTIDLKDYVKLQSYLADDTVEINKKNADINTDEAITISDLTMLRDMLLE